MSIRIPVTLVIEMDDEQEARYCKSTGLSESEKVRAKDVVDAARGEVLRLVRGYMADWATVTIKGR
jgi:hypothetical protein